MDYKRHNMILGMIAAATLWSAVAIGTVQNLHAQSFYGILKLLEGAGKVYRAYTMTDEELAANMREVMKRYDAENGTYSTESAYTKRLVRITRGMSDINGLPLNFKVYNMEEANAFASPDGSVRVTAKLLDIMTDNEVLGVIGHELGHLAGKHSIKEYKVALYLSAVRDGVMATDSDLGLLAASSLGDISEVLLNCKYSRDQEREADAYGFHYLKSHGKDPKAMADALRKLLSIQNNPHGKYARYVIHLFSTHPDLESRIELLDKME